MGKIVIAFILSILNVHSIYGQEVNPKQSAEVATLEDDEILLEEELDLEEADLDDFDEV